MLVSEWSPSMYFVLFVLLSVLFVLLLLLCLVLVTGRMTLSFSVTLLIVLVINFILVEAGVMIVSFSFSEPRSSLALLPLLFEGLSLLLHVPFGLAFSPGLPGLEGVLLEAWGCSAWGWASVDCCGAAPPAACCC